MNDRLHPRVRDALIKTESGSGSTDHQRKEIESMIDKHVAALERERRVMRPMFIYLTLLCTAFLLIGGYSDDVGKRLWFGIQACFWFLFGVMILLRYHINQVRIEVMAELKKIQIQLLERHDRREDQA